MLGKRFVETRENIADTFSLPKDVVSKATIVHIIGGNDVYIENYKGIMNYTRTGIDIKGYSNRINIRGTCLYIEYYGCEDMKIKGCIEEIKIL